MILDFVYNLDEEGNAEKLSFLPAFICICIEMLWPHIMCIGLSYAKKDLLSFKNQGRWKVLTICIAYNQDEVGIVAKLSECIASRGGNIHNADIFVPEKENVFYSRRFLSPSLFLFLYSVFF